MDTVRLFEECPLVFEDSFEGFERSKRVPKVFPFSPVYTFTGCTSQQGWIL